MKTALDENSHLAGIEKALIERLGRAGLVEEAIETTGHLLDKKGLDAFLRLADFFASLNTSFSVWLLQNGPRTLSSLPDPATRAETLLALLGMGKSKWSVVESACRKLSLLPAMSRESVASWLKHADLLADIDQDVALQYLEAGVQMIETLGQERFDPWASYGIELAKKSWKAAKEYFRASPEVIKKVDVCDLERWARLGMYLVEKSPSVKAGYSAQSLLAAGAAAGKAKKLDLGVQYFKSAAQILGRLSISELEAWVEEGLESADVQKDKGTSFFSLQSGSSRRAVDKLVMGLELKDIHSVLRSFAEALKGSKIELRSSSLFYKNLPGLSRFFSITDGTRIFLPPRVDLFEEEDLNFKTYKLMLTHELGHQLFGTFDLGHEDLGRLKEFGNPVPAFKIFEFLEDERVDHLIGLQYPGLERDRRHIMEVYLSKSSSSAGKMKRSIFELLSLRASEELAKAEIPDCRLTPLLKEALATVLVPGLSSRDVLDLTLKVYRSLNGESACEVCEKRDTQDRPFYRGALDFDLVENTKLGMRRLAVRVAEHLEDRHPDITPDLVDRALQRIEEAQMIDAEELLWQIEDSDKLNELFDEVQEVIADMEAEKRIRRSVYYDEWDRKLDDYRKDWCRVREMDMPSTTPLFYQKTIDENYGMVSLLRRYFGLLRPDRIKRFFREERGDDIDFDAVIEAVVERHAGRTPSDRVYIRREKNLRDVSVAFLVDMSYSTGDELPSGKRIIDVEREGLVLMAEALESIGDQWALYGFSTHYRDKVDFFVVRDFGEAFSTEVKTRFESIRPIAQTRLGAAVRHANSLLARQSSRIRLLILMSDGRPYDIDYGDADNAVEDTRRALWEGRKKGINSFCITVDKKSRDYLPYMYGETNYTLIDNIETLPARLPLIYKRLTT
jgi:nitric oxide reductase NorD protein